MLKKSIYIIIAVVLIILIVIQMKTTKDDIEDVDVRMDSGASLKINSGAFISDATRSSEKLSEYTSDSMLESSMLKITEEDYTSLSSRDAEKRIDKEYISSPIINPEKPIKQNLIQSGTLTAGDYDDNLNSHLYLNYQSDFFQTNKNFNLVPFINIKDSIKIEFINKNGYPISNKKIILKTENKIIKSYTTTNFGTINILPDYDNLPDEFKLVIIDGQKNIFEKEIKLSNIKDKEISFTINNKKNSSENLDIALIIDTTGSMTDELSYLQVELKSILMGIYKKNPNHDINLSIVAYRDAGDLYTVEEYEFTSDTAFIEKKLKLLKANGGGDYPEAMHSAFSKALDFKWRDNSTKVALLVADAPPHNQDFDKVINSINEAREKQIHIIPIASSGVDNITQLLMRSMALLTNSRYIFLTDDSGVGSPHAEPSVDCYVVTRLDNLIIRTIDSFIKGVRSEPNSDEVIRTSGYYNNGICSNN